MQNSLGKGGSTLKSIIKAPFGRMVLAVLVGATAGFVLSVTCRFVVALMSILGHGEGISRLIVVPISPVMSFEVIKAWMWVGALIGGGIVLLGLLRARSRARSSVAASLAVLWIASLGLFGWLQIEQHLDRQEIRQQYREFCTAVLEQRLEKAYGHLTPEYRSEFSIDEFMAHEAVGGQMLYGGQVLSCDLWPRHHIEVRGDTAMLYPQDLEFSALYGGLAFELEERHGEWYFTGWSTWYSD